LTTGNEKREEPVTGAGEWAAASLPSGLHRFLDGK